MHGLNACATIFGTDSLQLASNTNSTKSSRMAVLARADLCAHHPQIEVGVHSVGHRRRGIIWSGYAASPASPRCCYRPAMARPAGSVFVTLPAHLMSSGQRTNRERRLPIFGNNITYELMEFASKVAGFASPAIRRP